MLEFDYTQQFPLIGSSSKPSNLYQHVEAIFGVLRVLSIAVSISPNESGYEIKIVDNLFEITKLNLIYPKDKSKYKSLEISREKIESVEDLLSWVSSQVNYHFPAYKAHTWQNLRCIDIATKDNVRIGTIQA